MPCKHEGGSDMCLRSTSGHCIARREQYLSTNRGLINQRRRERHAVNPEENNRRCRKWKAANPNYQKDYMREWHAANPDHGREYTISHPGYNTAKHNRRRARKLNAPQGDASMWPKIIVELYDGRCACCGEHCADLTLDHSLPLSKGGAHDNQNFQPLCKPCNSSKHNRVGPYVCACGAHRVGGERFPSLQLETVH